MSDQRVRGIAWTDETWNPVRGCSRVSEGCRNCYAERQAARFTGPGQPYEGLAVVTRSGPRWTGEVRLVPERLEDPLRWKKPRRIFVNSMSDLFHEKLAYEDVLRVFCVMVEARQHTFQCLTKRAKRMREFFGWLKHQADGAARPGTIAAGAWCVDRWWPQPHVHLGVSVEDQPTADERIPELLATPAAVRWVSYEPALGPVCFTPYLGGAFLTDRERASGSVTGLDWIVVGGESGPNARPFDLAWARSTIAQCWAASVPCFVKQLGARPYSTACGEFGDTGMATLRDKKGGDPSEWPEDLRCRDFPEATR